MTEKFTKAFQQCNMDQVGRVVGASKSRKLEWPDGLYGTVHSGSDVSTYEIGSSRFPSFAMIFDVETSPTEPTLVGKKLYRWYRLGPSKNEDGTLRKDSIDAIELKGVFKKLFDEDPPCLRDDAGAPIVDESGNPVIDVESMCLRIAEEGTGTRWEVKIVRKGEYTNTYVNRIITT